MTLKFGIFLAVVFLSGVKSEEGWFWHVTDFHWDFSYWNGQLSCNGVGPDNPGVFGDEWCDSPWKLIEQTIKDMKTIKPDVEFVLWTGDSVPHVASQNLSTDINKELVRNITTFAKMQFSNVPIYATFGNHDYYKTNQFPPHGNEIYNATYDIWKEWINDVSQEPNFLKGGYYSIDYSEKIQIIALNTNMYYHKDALTRDLDDPADQFKWLEDELKQAKTNNKKAILTGHVPPGYTTPRAVRWMTSKFNDKMLNIMLMYADVISGMHFGHEHHDSFRLLSDGSGNPNVVLFIAPSVTPWRYIIGEEKEPAHNPGIRLVKYDKVTGTQLDILQYYFDLDTANNEGSITWKLGYNATSLYGIPDISPTSIASAIGNMAASDSEQFQDFIAWYNTNATQVMPCDSTCHNTVLCGIQNMDDLSFKICLDPASNSSNAILSSTLIIVAYTIIIALVTICFQL